MIVPFERLVGRRVIDSAGRRAGRFADASGETRGDQFVITHFTIATGRLTRFSIPDVIAFVLAQLGAHHGGHMVRVPWQQLDLSDLHHLRLRCRMEELKE